MPITLVKKSDRYLTEIVIPADVVLDGGDMGRARVPSARSTGCARDGHVVDKQKGTRSMREGKQKGTRSMREGPSDSYRRPRQAPAADLSEPQAETQCKLAKKMPLHSAYVHLHRQQPGLTMAGCTTFRPSALSYQQPSLMRFTRDSESGVPLKIY